MARFVAFLRAVNLEPRWVPMAQARAALEDLGYADVASYANSGNLIFTATGKGVDHEQVIRDRLESDFGFELTTFVRTARQVTTVASSKPFGDVHTNHTHFVLFTLTRLTEKERDAVEALSNERDEVVVQGRDVHWLIRARSPETTLGPKKWLDALPGNPTTARNMNLIRRLAAKL
jgi:uncharacterized protein (DUF1697 family)